ncbi:MAG: hypothetical protein M3P49_01305 [Actinomycetota bacterium]|nr:hypothetical protein [Actinomycetota bacterium]
MSVRKEDLQRLWAEERIAVHFPGETSCNEQDSESLSPADYGPPHEKGAIGVFAELVEEGGYVWAQSYVSDRVKVGYVRGRTEGGEGAVMERGARWDLRGKPHPGRADGHPATLKTLPMERVKEVAKKEAMHLRAARPPSVTICRWTSVGKRLRDLIDEGPRRIPEWSRLSTAEQEAACAEILRERHEGRPELPILKRLLLPVGRGLEDIDAYGFDEDGKHLYAQITHHRCGTIAAKEKAERLGEYAGREPGGLSLVFFCTGPAPQTEDAPGGVYFVSVDNDVTPWLLQDENYRMALFGA